MERWFGKVAVVTGATYGIGRAVAAELVERGVKVIALALVEEKLQALAEELKDKKGLIVTIKCDVRKLDDIKTAFDFTEAYVGPVSIVVNNAGIFEIAPLTEAYQKEAAKVVETNVIGLINCTMEATARMTKNEIEEGHIFNISRCGKHILPYYEGMGVYAASKHAVTALSECLRNDFICMGNENIRVTNISPGVVVSRNRCETDPEVTRLTEKDIADCLIFALQTPKHMNISEMTIQGVGELLSKFE